MLLQWKIFPMMAAVTTILISFLASYWIVEGTSVAANAMMENGATTISQDCLSWRDREIDVTEVFMVCDRQTDDQNRYDDDGTNRPFCKYGDLAKVAIGFTLQKELPYNSTIFLSMKTHYFGLSATIRNKTDICSYSNFGYVSDSDGSFQSDNGDCQLQTNMHYMLFTSFTIQDLASSSYQKSSTWEFKPDLSISFYAKDEPSSPLIGCVETGSRAQKALDQRRSKNGVLALFVSIVSFVTVFAVSLHSQNQRRKAVQLLENNRVASMIRRYQYSRKNNPANYSNEEGYYGVDSEGGLPMEELDRAKHRHPPPPWK